MRITIITPTLNNEKTVEKTIKSVIGQDYDDMEYIIVDGGSTDDTLKIVNIYGSHIACIISEKDRGIADAYNKGIRKATGDIIGIIAADDQLAKGVLNTLNRLYDGESDVFAGSVIRHNGNRYRIDESKKDLSLLKSYTSIRHPATFIKREAYSKYGLYSLDYKCAMDRELFLRFYLKGARFQIVDTPVVGFNVGGISTMNPIKYAYREDRLISILYGKNRFFAWARYYNSILHFKALTFLKMVLSLYPGGIESLTNADKRHRYLSEDDLENFI